MGMSLFVTTFTTFGTAFFWHGAPFVARSNWSLKQPGMYFPTRVTPPPTPGPVWTPPPPPLGQDGVALVALDEEGRLLGEEVDPDPAPARRRVGRALPQTVPCAAPARGGGGLDG